MILDIMVTDYSGKRRIAGKANGMFFYKRVSRKRHLFVSDSSWAIDAVVYHNLIVPNNLGVVIFDTDTNTFYTCRREAFDKFGQKRNYPPHKPQIFLSLVHFNTFENATENFLRSISDIRY